MSLRIVPAIAALLFLALAQAAQAVTYRCEMKPFTRFGWIPPQMVLIVAEDRSKALVFDNYIAELYKEPIPASVTIRKGEKLEIKWKIRNLPIGNGTQRVNVDYIAMLETKTLKATLRAFTYAHAYAPNGGGTCVVAK